MLRRTALRLPLRPALVRASSILAARQFSTTPRCLAPMNNPYTAAPSHTFQLLSESQKAGQAEEALYEAQVEEVEAWWRTERYVGIKRPYSAADVASKRGTVQQEYPSSLMARKLFDLLKERGSKGEPIHTS
jgi:isocitrate lyase